MRDVRHWLALAALLLSACGPPAEKSAAPAAPAAAAPGPAAKPAPLPDAIPYSDAIGQPAPVILPPFNLPFYAPIGPGATIENAQAGAPSGGPGGIVTFRSPSAPEQIAHFYRAHLEQEFAAVSDAETAGVRLLSAERVGGAERIDISIAPAAEGGSRVTISYVLPR